MSFSKIEDEIEKEKRSPTKKGLSPHEQVATWKSTEKIMYALHYLYLCWRPILITFYHRCKR